MQLPRSLKLFKLSAIFVFEKRSLRNITFILTKLFCSVPDISHQDIHLVTPSFSEKPLEAALAQNPYLTSLPHPKANVVAPTDLTDTTGTAELLRLPEIQELIRGDFLILPCDLVCELPGELLLDAWMVQNGPSVASSSLTSDLRKVDSARAPRKCGVGIWFETKGDDFVKGAETDFIVTTSFQQPVVKPAKTSLRHHMSKLLYTSTTDTLRDTMQEESGLSIRTGMIRKHQRVSMRTTYRTSHLYVFPFWMKDVIKQNERFDSINEDIIGWWAKAGWQDGLAEKLHMNSQPQVTLSHHQKASSRTGIENFDHLITTQSRTLRKSERTDKVYPPPILAYTHPHDSPLLIRRVDTSALLLSTSLYLARSNSSDPITGSNSSPLSHPTKISTDASLIAPHTTIDVATTIIGPNTSVATHCTIKSSCIGANCTILEGAKLLGSLLMDGVRVENKATVQSCILGRRCVIGQGAKLDGCEVQEGFKVDNGTVGTKGQKFSVFEGLENGLDNLQDDDEDATDLINHQG